MKSPAGAAFHSGFREAGETTTAGVAVFRAGIPIPAGSGGLGIVGVLILLAVMWFLGIDPRTILDDSNGGGGISFPRTEAPREAAQPASAEEQDEKKMASVVLKTTEDVWTQEFQQMGKTYTPPKLVLYRGDLNSRCGLGAAQMGPFYCPLDHKVYLDLSFFDDMKNRLNAPGEFAEAYVIAHEVGHHVQTLLGIMDKVMAARAHSNGKIENNAIQVKTELQADCFAGIWANHAQKDLQFVDPGDIEEALNAAAAIGDDRLQTAYPGPRGSGRLHAWQFGAARDLVQEGLRRRQFRCVRYVWTADLNSGRRSIAGERRPLVTFIDPSAPGMA